jgi:hypothetical protein
MGNESEHTRDKLLQKFADDGLASEITTSVTVLVATAGLIPVELLNAVVATPFAIEPMNASTPTIAWTNSNPGQVARITASFEVGTNTDTLEAVLIGMPFGFEHRIVKLSDVEVDLPISTDGGPWAETWVSHMLRVYVHIEPSSYLARGVYSISFDAVVPPAMPALNMWTISLCVSRTCDSTTSPDAALTLAVPGFEMGERMKGFVESAACPRETYIAAVATKPMIMLTVLLAALRS